MREKTKTMGKKKQERFKKLRCPFCWLPKDVSVYEALQNPRGSYEYGSMNCGWKTFVVGTKDNVYKRASELVKGMKKRHEEKTIFTFLSPEEFFNHVNFALNGR